MSSEDLKNKILESLNKAGVTTDHIENDKAVNKADPEALYRKACSILNRSSCQFSYPSLKIITQSDMIDRINGKFSSLPNGVDKNGEWFQLLNTSAQAGNTNAFSDMLLLIETAFIKNAGLFYFYSKKAADETNFTYIDELGVSQPYSFRVARILLRGRVHILTEDEKARFRALHRPPQESEIQSWFDNNEVTENKTKKGFKQAIKYFKKAADQGSSAAMSWLSQIYYYGGKIFGHESEKPDKVKALEWYHKLESSGGYKYYEYRIKDCNISKTLRTNHLSFYQIGDLYSHGAPGVPVNLDKGVEYLTKAVEAGNQDAIKKLQEILERIEKKGGGGFFSKLFGKK